VRLISPANVHVLCEVSRQEEAREMRTIQNGIRYDVLHSEKLR
jgi:hypothetical protein